MFPPLRNILTYPFQLLKAPSFYSGWKIVKENTGLCFHESACRVGKGGGHSLITHTILHCIFIAIYVAKLTNKC